MTDMSNAVPIGQSIRRKEDYRFLTGGGRYTDDIDARIENNIQSALIANQRVITALVEKENLSSDDALLLFSDTLKFLHLCAASEKPLAPPEKIDIGWHHFILHTHEYANFCQNTLGKFVHHAPSTKEDKLKQTDNFLMNTKELANIFFDDLSDNWNFNPIGHELPRPGCLHECDNGSTPSHAKHHALATRCQL